MALEWTIEADGKVTGLGVVGDEFRDTVFATCVGAAVARWEFPPAASGRFVYSFKF